MLSERFRAFAETVSQAAKKPRSKTGADSSASITQGKKPALPVDKEGAVPGKTGNVAVPTRESRVVDTTDGLPDILSENIGIQLQLQCLKGQRGSVLWVQAYLRIEGGERSRTAGII